MRNFARIFAGIAAVGAVVLVGRLDAAQPAPKKTEAACPNPQSPRKLTSADWDRRDKVPKVSPGTQDSIEYSPSAGVKLVLHPCSQHYHCLIENFQGCPGQVEPDPRRACPELKAGNWVEIHTAYHVGPTVNPLPENLGKCDGNAGPLVVVGYHAKVTAPLTKPALPLHFGPPAAEWSGSSTNNENDDPPSCKAPAFWHFALGCDFTVSTAQLGQFHHPDEARRLQPPDRLSHDLTLIEVSKKPK
jgi:hypothetical protein